MSRPAFRLALRLRAVSTGLAALGMVAVILMVGALFPAVGDSFGELDLPEGVAELLGGAEYTTLTGWLKTEIASFYGPLVMVVALATWAGLIAGVALAGGGIGVAELGAQALHLGFFGLATGSVSLMLAAATGRRALASACAGAFAILGFLINGLAPLVDEIAWLKYLSPFYYYAAHDPLVNGFDAGRLAVLGLFALALTALAMERIRRRDLRA